MRKIIPYLAGVVIAVLAIIPPLEFSINFTNSPIKFVWTFLFCGALAFFFIFTKANIWLKIILPYLFLNSFLSRIPHVSMAEFIWVTIACYFYLLCLEIDDWRPVFKIALSLLALETLLVLLKSYGKETLLNFGPGATSCFGSVGNDMQLKSLFIILIAMAIQLIKPARRYLIIACALFLGIAAYYYFTDGVWYNFMCSRGPIWLKAIEASGKHPFIGYGIGTFNSIFPVLSTGVSQLEGVWTNAHNDFLQFLFSAGIIGFVLLGSCSITTLLKCRGFLLIGALLVLFTMNVHFPLEQNSTQLLIFAFFAYADKKTRRQLCPVQDPINSK